MLWTNIPDLYKQADEEDGAGALRKFVDSIRPSFDVLRRGSRDFGDLRDALRVVSQYDGRGRFRLGRRVEVLGESEQRGIDGEVTSARAFRSITARFTPDVRGKRVTLAGSSLPGNNNTFLVGAWIDAYTVVLDPLPEPDAGPLRWTLRPLVLGDADSVVVEVQEGDVGLLTLGWLLTDGAADYPIRGRQRFLRPTTERRPLTEREGVDGTIDALGRFVSALAVFDRRNVGQILSLNGTEALGNKGYARIRSIAGTVAPQLVSLSDVSTGAAITLTQEATPFHWALYPRSLVTVRTNGPPVGTVEQEGYDFDVLTSVGDIITFSAPGATLDADRDLGKIIRLVSFANPTTNNRLLRLVALAGPTTGTAQILSPAFPGVGAIVVETDMFWELRGETGLGDLVQVEAHPASILQYLATDFGITIDTQESEDIQRSWVKNVTSWLDLKGTAKGYEVIGLVSGFDVEAEALYRITLDIASTIPDASEVEYREFGVGRAGTVGTFTAVGPAVQFSDTTATFTAGDEGRLIRIQGAAVAGNNRLYTIQTYINATTLVVREADEPTLPDGNNGSLQWNVVRLYTTLPPLLPGYDEINNDVLSEYLAANPPAGDFFKVDTFCWEEGFSTTALITITSVTTVIPGKEFQVFFTGPGDVVASIGRWFFQDGAGAFYFLETVPIEHAPGTWKANVKAVVAPTAGAGKLIYQCAPNLICEYCGAAKVLATISVGASIALTPAALERYRERILQRLTEVIPAHVELIPRFETILEATLSLSAEILAGHVSATLVAPLTAVYDEIGADIFGDPAFDGVTMYYTDLGLLATVETP